MVVHGRPATPARFGANGGAVPARELREGRPIWWTGAPPVQESPRMPTDDADRTRDYKALTARASGLGAAPATQPQRDQRMQELVDLLWPALSPTGVSWLGFYVIAADGAGMTLAARRDKPACSPIGMHGACGRCFLTRQPLVVRDVRDLGENYVACDPRDQSEVVLPCLEPDGTAWGVLDLDSFDVGSFTSADAAGLAGVLRAAGLSA